jgi:hypothetical protein
MANRDVLAIGTSGRRENTDKAREFEREMDIIRASIRRMHRLARWSAQREGGRAHRFPAKQIIRLGTAAPLALRPP